MGERTLEERLRDALVEEPTPHGFNVHFREMDADALALAISTALTLARREGALQGWRAARPPNTQGERGYVENIFNDLISLPTRTVRKLREEPDPHGTGFAFRFDEGRIQSEAERGVWVPVKMVPTSERLALWHGLMQHPYHEEQVPVDPEEILP